MRRTEHVLLPARQRAVMLAAAFAAGVVSTTACAGSASPDASSAGPPSAALSAMTPGTATDQTTARASSVVLVSVDGLNPEAIRRLGRSGAPTLTRLLATGTGTSNARTAQESRQTLPNHVSIITGRRVANADGGHGVTWNDARATPRTVSDAAGEAVSSIFTVVDEEGGSSAVFAAKSKFALLQRSWPGAVDHSRVVASDGAVLRAARSDLQQRHRKLRFVHLAAPDRVGHARGFMTRPYLDAVRRTDRRLGELFTTLRTSRHSRNAAVVLTSDHGGSGGNHVTPSLANSRVLLVARGPGVARGANLYALDPGLFSPGRERPGYGSSRPPARNLAAGNVALQLVGLGPVPGSEPEAEGPFRLR